MKRAGVLVPLFSIPSRASWGIGEIPDLVRLAGWMTAARMDFVQLLPVNDMDDGLDSPYAARSAMAIDPVYVAPAVLEDFAAAGGEPSLPPESRAALETARRSPVVQYKAVRAAKSAALQAAFAAFEGCRGERQDSFARFLADQRWWLDDYALFLALHEEYGGRYWREWDEEVRDRRAEALQDARRRLGERIRYHSYVQWVADVQWRQARRSSGARIFGDFPFMVSGHSADVWARQQEFRLDASVGVPPDATSPEGQDWGLPAYRWDVCAAGGYEWLRQRTTRAAALYDGFRVDHLVGFYRTYVRERDGSAAFLPAAEDDQLRQGESLLRIFAGAGSTIVAEDLGTVPGFVRASLARMEVPGMKVLRWEREWDEPQQPFRDPPSYPAASVATTGTHDTETLAQWWEGAPREERVQCAAAPAMRAAGLDPDAPFSAPVRDALLQAVVRAGSNMLILPIQDIFGWADRINDPADSSGRNWTWRLPWPVEDLLVEPEAVARAAFLRSL